MAKPKLKAPSAPSGDPDAGPVTALIPLSDLYLHALNTRSDPPPADIEALADSIAAIGLLQNLAGYIDPANTLQPGKTGIVAGGRRLRALELLAHRDGRSADAVTVPVRIAPDLDAARLWASAENEARQGLHPADEVRAYARMAAAGADPSTIARAFAVTERKVRGRLALANLPDATLGALRAGKITLDQAAALTYAPTEEVGRAELHRVLTSQWPISPDNIRNRCAPAGVTGADRRIKWLGIDNYRQAGGRVQEDLFVDQLLILDETLLQDLFSARLTRMAEEIRAAEGWAWVTPHLEEMLSYIVTEPYTIIQRVPLDLPEADEAELDDLQERASEQELTPAELSRMDELEARQAGDFAAEDLAQGGLWLYVNRAGELVRSFPYRPRPARSAAGDDDAATTVKPDRIPQVALDDYGILRRLSLQQALLDQPQLALDLLAVHLSARVWGYQRPLALSMSPPTLVTSKPEGLRISARLTEAAAAINDLGPSRDYRDLQAGHLAEVQAMGKTARDRLLSHAIAALLCRSEGDFCDHLAQIAGAHVRQIWTPAVGDFARLPSAMLDGIWAELVPADRAEPEKFAAKKKADKAKELGRLFNDQDFREALQLDRETCARIDLWAPPECRWPEVQDQAAQLTSAASSAEEPANGQ